MKRKPVENHRITRTGWLRAAVLGANDGIISTASLILGMAASSASHDVIILAGVAGLVAGAMSMAAGEYVSVSSQSDIEKADYLKEQHELQTMPEAELKELADIYKARGLEPDLAMQVAVQLTEKDALKAHLRDELGITSMTQSRPLQAAIVSALLFVSGAALPLLVTLFCSEASIFYWVSGASLFSLCTLGGIASYVGGASIIKGITRVTFWGVMAMVTTSLIGSYFNGGIGI